MENQSNEIPTYTYSGGTPPSNKALKRRVLIIVLVVAVLLSGVGYWYGTTTPYYSIKKIGKAIASHDMATFQKYVDMDSLASGLYENIAAAVLQDPDEVNTNINEMAKGVLDVFKPKIVEHIKVQMQAYVKDGNFDAVAPQSEQSPIDLQGWVKNTGIETARLGKIKYIRQADGMTVVGIETVLPKYSAPMVLEFKMRDCGAYWQLMDMSNLGAAITGIKALQRAQLEMANQPVVDSMNAILAFNRITPTYIPSKDGLNAAVEFLIGTTNRGLKPIQEIQMELRVTTEEGKLILKEPLTVQGSWASGAKIDIAWAKPINSLVNTDKLLYETPMDQLSFKIKPLRIRFTDNTEYKLKDKLE